MLQKCNKIIRKLKQLKKIKLSTQSKMLSAVTNATTNALRGLANNLTSPPQESSRHNGINCIL